MITLSINRLDPQGHWTKPITGDFHPQAKHLEFFDQNGYDLSEIEQAYAEHNDRRPLEHRGKHRMAIKQDWFTQDHKIEGAVLNHSLLFERKGYAGDAFEQLETWAKDLPLLYKITAMRPKWGLDFSMDWVDRDGNAFEILHWEFDGFSYEEIMSAKAAIEPVLLGIDFEQAGKDMLKNKDQWHHLDFFEQSDWKCAFFGIPKERFKMVIWE